MSSTEVLPIPGTHDFIETSSGPEASAPTCIVAIGYNRPKALLRLLRSVTQASYHQPVDLFVSIDGGESAEDMVTALSDIRWPHGRLTIRRARQNLGLRDHVLKCGDIVCDGYDALVMLEDDLCVGPNFHTFAVEAARRYSADDRVAGISLYSPSFNEMAELPFEPDGVRSADVYSMQSAQSWGQCWSADMWNTFRAWYRENRGELRQTSDLPAKIYSWPQTSWKKYAMKFAATTGRTWIYPYVSHSTNFAESGAHNPYVTNLYQRNLDRAAAGWSFPGLDEMVAYDPFFERIPNNGDKRLGTLNLDLYATKLVVTGPTTLATVRSLNRPHARSYALSLRPHESNVMQAVAGNDIRVYEIADGESLDLSEFPATRAYSYYLNVGWKVALRVGLSGLRHAVLRRMPSVFR